MKAKKLFGPYFAKGELVRSPVLKVTLTSPQANGDRPIAPRTFANYMDDLFDARLIERDPAIRHGWRSTALWDAELAGRPSTEGDE